MTQGPWTVIGGGRGMGAGGGGVNLTVNVGGVTINGMTGGDMSKSSRELAQQIGKYLAEERIIEQIAAGSGAC